MKIFLILLILSFTNAMAEIDQLPLPTESPIGCKAVSFIKETKPSCSKKESKKIVYIAPIKIPKRKNIELEKIKTQLSSLTKEFAKYKKEQDEALKRISTQLSKKDKKIKKIQTKLTATQKQLSKNRKRLASLEKIPKRKIIKREEIREEIEPKDEIMPMVDNLPWVEIVVEDGINIYQLALRYYGDKKEYKKIYVANQNSIGKDFKLIDGMPLKIPMTEQFEEQPMILNIN